MWHILFLNRNLRFLVAVKWLCILSIKHQSVCVCVCIYAHQFLLKLKHISYFITSMFVELLMSWWWKMSQFQYYFQWLFSLKMIFHLELRPKLRCLNHCFLYCVTSFIYFVPGKTIESTQSRTKKRNEFNFMSILMK